MNKILVAYFSATGTTKKVAEKLAKAPRIIQTFIEKHNLSGKKIITFATSGGSGIKGSTDFLKKNYSELNIIEGKRFEWNESLESIGAWVEKIKKF